MEMAVEGKLKLSHGYVQLCSHFSRPLVVPLSWVVFLGVYHQSEIE